MIFSKPMDVQRDEIFDPDGQASLAGGLEIHRSGARVPPRTV
jgi:hypothetical protein